MLPITLKPRRVITFTYFCGSLLCKLELKLNFSNDGISCQLKRIYTVANKRKPSIHTYLYIQVRIPFSIKQFLNLCFLIYCRLSSILHSIVFYYVYILSIRYSCSISFVLQSYVVSSNRFYFRFSLSAIVLQNFTANLQKLRKTRIHAKREPDPVVTKGEKAAPNWQIVLCRGKF